MLKFREYMSTVSAYDTSHLNGEPWFLWRWW